MVEVKKDETLDDLILSGLKIIQKSSGFRFSIDAVLLAHFSSLKKGDQVIDLGTGTGIIPLILFARNPEVEILGIDIQQLVVEMAQRSILLNKLPNINIIQGDFRKLPNSHNGKYNLVISNPPYLPLEQGKISSNQSLALSRHEIMCNLKEIITTASRLLNNGGRVSLVHRSNRLGEIITQMHHKKLEPKRIRLVYPQIDKSANLVLIEGVKGAKPGLIVEPPLVVYNELGTYTKEILKIYSGGEE